MPQRRGDTEKPFWDADERGPTQILHMKLDGAQQTPLGNKGPRLGKPINRGASGSVLTLALLKFTKSRKREMTNLLNSEKGAEDSSIQDRKSSIVEIRWCSILDPPSSILHPPSSILYLLFSNLSAVAFGFTSKFFVPFVSLWFIISCRDLLNL